MPYKFNPLTGQLDYFKSSAGGSNTIFYKDQKVVDANFLATPDITLSGTPANNSELVFLNGLFVDNTNYSIVGNTLTMVVAQLRVGDTLDINFAS